MPLSTNVAAGDPDHAELHNEEREAINAAGIIYGGGILVGNEGLSFGTDYGGGNSSFGVLLTDAITDPNYEPWAESTYISQETVNGVPTAGIAGSCTQFTVNASGRYDIFAELDIDATAGSVSWELKQIDTGPARILPRVEGNSPIQLFGSFEIDGGSGYGTIEGEIVLEEGFQFILVFAIDDGGNVPASEVTYAVVSMRRTG